MRRMLWFVVVVFIAACGRDAPEGIGTVPPTAALSPTSSVSTAVPETSIAPEPTVTSTTISSATDLRPADAPAPVGTCEDFEIRPMVFVVVGLAAQPGSAMSCTKLAPSQELLLVNQSSETVHFVIGGRGFEVPVTDREYFNAGRAGDLLAPGLHTLGERQYWLVAEAPRRLPTAEIEMGRYGPLTLGMTVRQAQAAIGGELLVDPRFNSMDGHPVATTPGPMAPYGHAYLATYDASVPVLSLRANGTDPLDAVIIWISSRRGTVPAPMRVGWTQPQVRELYGDRLVKPGFACPSKNQVILAVYDGAPVVGTNRLWFVFEDGLLAYTSTSSVSLGETGVLDC
jgi:hypothetical protein